jgi:hypothetical protein
MIVPPQERPPPVWLVGQLIAIIAPDGPCGKMLVPPPA